MIKFTFIARCGEETLPLEVALEYRTGDQNQRARRVAVGQLLGILAAESATVNASGSEMVTIATEQGTWVIAEAGSRKSERGLL